MSTPTDPNRPPVDALRPTPPALRGRARGSRRRSDLRARPRLRRLTGIVVCATALSVGLGTSTATADRGAPTVRTLARFVAAGCTGQCGSGSTIGPDGALYVTAGVTGEVLRIDPHTGAVDPFAHGLPKALPAVGLGGATDVAFLGRTAYVLVTLVGAVFGDPGSVDGIYRVNADGGVTAVADLGAWSVAHPPATTFAVPSGVQYAMQPYRGGFLVTDGHHNRLLHVRLDGRISEVAAFGNIVPTGLETSGHRVLMAEAGPVPHRPADGKVVVLDLRRGTVTTVASGAPLLVDVETGPRHRTYALSQGRWDYPDRPENAGLPASPNTGSLTRVPRHGGQLQRVVSGLDRPTSIEFLGDSAYVVTLTGTVLRIAHVSGHH